MKTTRDLYIWPTPPFPSPRYDFISKPKPAADKKKRMSVAASKELEGWVFAGADRVPLETKLTLREKTYANEQPGTVVRIFRDGRQESPPVPEERAVGPECQECKGNERRKCKTCG